MKDAVRDRYAHAARTLPVSSEPPTLGLGDVVALAAPRGGETVLDLGSGPGRDLLAAARAVGPDGRAVGIDMLPEMRARAAEAAEAAGLENVSVVDGDLEALPLPCGSVDVVISNCVINLVDDKRRALTEAYRVLAPGGRFAVLDTAFEAEPGEELRSDAEAWSCCEAGSLVASDYEAIMRAIGYEDVALRFADGGCGRARAVAVTARKPGAAGDPVRPAVGGEDATFVLPGRGRITLERYGATAYVRGLEVGQPHRRRGIGTRLVIAALEAARWSGAQEVYLLTVDAHRFFERLAFVPVSRVRAAAACPAPQLHDPACDGASAMRLSFEEADLPLLGRPSRKELPTFQGNACC